MIGVWNNRFYRGKLGFVAGEPGLGKSLIAIHMAATISTGGPWPHGKGSARRGDVIYISAEDSAADTIRPRLEAAGADLGRVHLVEKVTDALGSRPFSLVEDLGRLDQWLGAIRKPRLVVIDPANGCLIRAAISEMKTPSGAAYDPRRYFLDDSDLFYSDGKTWALSNQWSIKSIPDLDQLISTYPESKISYSVAEAETE